VISFGSASKADRLKSNKGISFIGTQRNGPFTVERGEAERLLAMPTNPNGRSNSDVVRKWSNGIDLTRRSSDTWIIDFGDIALEKAMLYEAPFAQVEREVKPTRENLRRQGHREKWWIYGENRPGLRAAVKGIDRMLVTAMVAKYRNFVWLPEIQIPENLCVAIARNDDTTFGILHSRFHELWSLRMGTFLGVGNDPRYTPSTTFETFPFPEGLTPNIPAADYAADPRAVAIAAAAARLNELRENWLNPADLVNRVPEVVPGYPDRLLPKDDVAAAELKKRTLTNLYNARPAWLQHAHKALDEAVAEAYGWGDDWRGGKLTEDEILSRLFRLNQTRAAAEAAQKSK